MDSLKVLDPEGPIREADISITLAMAGCFRFFTFTQCFDLPP
jgi:hypothetical protein